MITQAQNTLSGKSHLALLKTNSFLVILSDFSRMKSALLFFYKL